MESADESIRNIIKEELRKMLSDEPTANPTKKETKKTRKYEGGGISKQGLIDKLLDRVQQLGMENKVFQENLRNISKISQRSLENQNSLISQIRIMSTNNRDTDDLLDQLHTEINKSHIACRQYFNKSPTDHPWCPYQSASTKCDRKDIDHFRQYRHRYICNKFIPKHMRIDPNDSGCTNEKCSFLHPEDSYYKK